MQAQATNSYTKEKLQKAVKKVKVYNALGGGGDKSKVSGRASISI